MKQEYLVQTSCKYKQQDTSIIIAGKEISQIILLFIYASWGG